MLLFLSGMPRRVFLMKELRANIDPQALETTLTRLWKNAQPNLDSSSLGYVEVRNLDDFEHLFGGRKPGRITIYGDRVVVSFGRTGFVTFVNGRGAERSEPMAGTRRTHIWRGNL